MYDFIEMGLIEAKVMTMLQKLEWQGKDGNRVEFESNTYGCKVTGKFSQPGMVLLGDEVGGNIDMTGDGHILGDLFLRKVILHK